MIKTFSQPQVLETKRLRLRQWQADDMAESAKMHADPEVMKYFPHPLSAAENSRFVEKLTTQLISQGWGCWVVELLEGQQFVGFVGLSQLADQMPMAPGVEMAWRLARVHWGQGLASEAANAVLAFGFERLQLAEIIAITTVFNDRSQAVMSRLGMINSGANFLHPALPSAHPLAEHVLYRLTLTQWLQSKPA